LTEQGKMASREEKNEEETRKKRAGWSFFIIGLIVSLIGYIFYDFHINHYLITQTGRKVLLRSEYPYQVVGLFLIIIGIVIILIGVGKKIYSRYAYM
jgi:uncharacterized membrane protein YiaA